MHGSMNIKCFSSTFLIIFSFRFPHNTNRKKDKKFDTENGVSVAHYFQFL